MVTRFKNMGHSAQRAWMAFGLALVGVMALGGSAFADGPTPGPVDDGISAAATSAQNFVSTNATTILVAVGALAALSLGMRIVRRILR